MPVYWVRGQVLSPRRLSVLASARAKAALPKLSVTAFVGDHRRMHSRRQAHRRPEHGILRGFDANPRWTLLNGCWRSDYRERRRHPWYAPPGSDDARRM